MFRKALTHLIILALTVLPVQVISAGVENSNMRMSMQQMQASNDCMHGDNTEQASVKKSCCDDQSHQCDSCDNCPQISSATYLPTLSLNKIHSFKTHKYFVSHLLLNGTSQQNLLRPPRTPI